MPRHPPRKITEFKSENQRRFVRLAEELFGEYWQNPAAKALAVNHRHLYRWVSGESEPPDEIIARLEGMARKKCMQLMRVAGNR